jgi:hypothetical protein
MNRTLRLICLGLLLTIVGLQAACDDWTPDDRALVRSFAEDWLRSKNMHPTHEDGSINWLGTANIARRAVTGRSGDSEVDAVLDAYDVLSNIHEADRLMAQGMAQGDADAIDQAIARRPGDWTYRTARAAVALINGDAETYEEQRSEAEQIVFTQGIDPVWYHQQSIQALGEVAGQVETAPQCQAILNQMALHYAELFDLTGQPSYAERANNALDTTCP